MENIIRTPLPILMTSRRPRISLGIPNMVKGLCRWKPDDDDSFCFNLIRIIFDTCKTGLLKEAQGRRELSH
jgi:hypothetical protein